MVQTKMPSKEALWALYGKMVCKIAHNLSEKLNTPVDELISEGWWGVEKQLHLWNPERSKLQSWVYQCAYFQMYDSILAKKKEVIFTNFEDDEGNKIDPPAKRSILSMILAELSEEAKSLVKYAIEAPGELRELLNPKAPVYSRRILKEFMIDVLDWEPEKVEKAWREVTLCLQ